MAKTTKLKDLIPDNKNFNKGTEYGNSLIEKSLRKFGAGRSILIDKNNRIIAGNKTIENAAAIGLEDLQIVESDGTKIIAVKRTDIDLDSKAGRELALADNATAKANIDWDIETTFEVANEFGFDAGEWGIEAEQEEQAEAVEKQKKLSDRFIIPPFSVLDTRQAIWQERKNYWLSLGIEKEVERTGTWLNSSSKSNKELIQYLDSGKAKYSKKTKDIITKMQSKSNGISIFDPVLCELSYKWFNLPNGKILDPFAGGSVRGIVAAKLGFQYLGNDLRSEQIEANRINAKEVLKDVEIYPTWTCGDSLKIDTIAKDYKADMIFSCPPYADLEVYSELKEDISNMPYPAFLATYKEIIRKSCNMLNNDRFAVFVVGEVRSKSKGGYSDGYYCFIKDTIDIFLENNLIFYNDIVLLNPVGSAALTCANAFNGGRKVKKIHQNVLVFYKGNPRNIKKNYPELDLSYMELQIEETS